MPQSREIQAFVVMGRRCKIASIEQQSIPRLQLDAAVLVIRLSQFIQSYLRSPLSSGTFRTEGTTLLHWIRLLPNKKRMYPIMSKTSKNQQSLNCGST